MYYVSEFTHFVHEIAPIAIWAKFKNFPYHMGDSVEIKKNPKFKINPTPQFQNYCFEKQD